jgi:NADPH:quinone reductase-like Zn-dependent oxidoreductase
MKAVRFHPPGGFDKLQYGEEPVADSDLQPGEMLIRVHAVGLIWTELFWPIYQKPDGSYYTHIPGHDFSGMVTKIGPGFEDSEIRPGTDVLAFTSKRKYGGAMAEYAKADLTQVIRKPGHLSHVEAASVVLTALTAWQALHEHAQLQKGQKLLVTGAAGGTGIFAVQIAKMIGVHVIGTASSERSFELLRELEIDEIIDYKKSKLDNAVSNVDVVLDTVGGEALEQGLRALKKNGLCININDPDCGKKADQVGV